MTKHCKTQPHWYSKAKTLSRFTFTLFDLTVTTIESSVTSDLMADYLKLDIHWFSYSHFLNEDWYHTIKQFAIN